MKTTDVHGYTRTNEHPYVVITAKLKGLTSFICEKQIYFGGEGEIFGIGIRLIAPTAFAVY